MIERITAKNHCVNPIVAPTAAVNSKDGYGCHIYRMANMGSPPHSNPPPSQRCENRDGERAVSESGAGVAEAEQEVSRSGVLSPSRPFFSYLADPFPGAAASEAQTSSLSLRAKTHRPA